MAICPPRDIASLLAVCRHLQRLRELAWGDAIRRDYSDYAKKTGSNRDIYEYAFEIEYTNRMFAEAGYKSNKENDGIRTVLDQGYFMDRFSSGYGSISVSNKNIRMLPPRQFTADYLDISNNNITVLAGKLRLCAHRVDLSRNQIHYVQDGPLFRCTRLDLSHNEISEIRGTFNGVRQTLVLAHNSISTVPEWWNPNIEEIDMSYNHLTVLNSGNFLSCKELDLSHNNIQSIPGDWAPVAKKINLLGNPIPEEQIKKLRQRLPGRKILYQSI